MSKSNAEGWLDGCDKAGEAVCKLSYAIHEVERSTLLTRASVSQLLKSGAWRAFKWNGVESSYNQPGDFRRFIQEPRPRGLGTTAGVLRGCLFKGTEPYQRFEFALGRNVNDPIALPFDPKEAANELVFNFEPEMLAEFMIEFQRLMSPPTVI